MPDLQTLNSVATTVSDKVSSLATKASGAVSGVNGSVSSGVNGFSTSLGAASSELNKQLQKVGNLSLPSLSAATSQVVGALQPQSMYRGLQKRNLPPTEKQPSETREEKTDTMLRFPANLGAHYIQIEFTSFAAKSPIAPQIKQKPVYIMLPMSPNLSETYQANYKTESLGVLGKAADEITSKFLNGNPFAGKPEEAGKKLGEVVNEYIKTQGKETAGSLLAQIGMNATGAIGAAVSKNLGAAVNPNMAVLFDNISFRSHSFSFKLFPTSMEESLELKKIITTMRQRMLPPLINNFFFGYPDTAKIQIYPKSPFPILESVLESMTVNYAPNGPAFFGGSNMPVEVDLTLNFREIKIFDRSVGAEGTSVNPTALQQSGPN